MANIQRKYGICNGLDQKYAIGVLETWDDGSTRTWYAKQGGILDSHLGYECLHFDTVDAAVQRAKQLQEEWDSRPQDDVIDWPADEDPQTNNLKVENHNLRTEIKQLQERLDNPLVDVTCTHCKTHLRRNDACIVEADGRAFHENCHLQMQIEALKDSEQDWIDKAINFRNLAVALGAKPEQLNDEYCVKLVHDHEQVLMENIALKKKLQQALEILQR